MKLLYLLVSLLSVSSYAFHRISSSEILKVKRPMRFTSSSSLLVGKHKCQTSSSIPVDRDPVDDLKPNYYYTKALEFYNVLKNKEQRNELLALFFAGMRVLGSRIVRSIRDETDKGKRGEEWVLMEIFFFSFFFFGLPEPVSKFVRFCGAFSIMFGLYTFCRAMWTLKDSISPFVTPIFDNILVTDGIYSLVRHPMYCGVLFFTAGVSTFYDCVDKAIVTIILAVLLVTLFVFKIQDLKHSFILKNS